jgi:hypothetical protein
MPIQYKEGEDYVTSSATTMISVALAEGHERNMDGDTSWKLQMEAKRTTCVVNVIDLMHFVATPEQMEVLDDPEPAINDPKWQDWHKALITACREIEDGSMELLHRLECDGKPTKKVRPKMPTIGAVSRRIDVLKVGPFTGIAAVKSKPAATTLSGYKESAFRFADAHSKARTAKNAKKRRRINHRNMEETSDS